MKEYIYDQSTMPNIATTDPTTGETSGIYFAVKESSISGRNCLYCTWLESTGKLSVFFEDCLSADEKLVLDQLVIDNA